MATFAQDTFTSGSAGTVISDGGRSPEAGTWTAHPSNAGSLILSDAARCRQSDANTTRYTNSGSPASADYDVQATIRHITSVTDQFLGVLARCDTVDNTMYVAWYWKTTGKWHIGKYFSGAFTDTHQFGVPGTQYTQALSADTDYVLLLQVRDNGGNVDLTLKVDGTTRVTCTDTTDKITAAGKAGMMGAYAGASNSTGMHLDDFSAFDPVAGSPSLSPGVGAVVLAGTTNRLGFSINMPSEA